MAGTQLRKRDQYQRLKSALWTARSPMETMWREVGEYAKPNRLRLVTSDRNQGDKRNHQTILDNTATMTMEACEAGLHAGMSSPTRPWFKLSTLDRAMNQSGAVKAYLFETERRMNAVLAVSNFYNAVPETLGDVAAFGTAAMACFQDAEDIVRFYTYPLGSFGLAFDDRRKLCTFVLEDQLTVRQVVKAFGVLQDGTIQNPEHFSLGVARAWEKGDHDNPVEVCWVVMPNEYADHEKLDAKYLPYTSCWFEQGRDGQGGNPGDQVLRESGFRTFPVMAPRWKVTANDSYGTSCPGLVMRGDVKQLQGMERTGNVWLNKFANPPLVGPSSLENKPTSNVAGHITYSDPRDEASRLRPIHTLTMEGYQHFEAKMQQVRGRIEEAGFKNLFLMLNSNPYGQPMTAAEVQERHQEKLLMLGPALERLNEELYDPLIDRVWDVMADMGLLPEPPQELQGTRIKVEFTSILADAQKLVRVVGTDRFLTSIGALAQFKPGVLDKIDEMEVVDEYGEALGVKPTLIRPTDEALARVAARAQQAAQAQAAQQMKDVSGAMKNAATSPMTGDTALTRIAQQLGAA